MKTLLCIAIVSLLSPLNVFASGGGDAPTSGSTVTVTTVPTTTITIPNMIVDFSTDYTAPESFTTHSYECMDVPTYDVVKKEWSKQTPKPTQGMLYSFFQDDNMSFSNLRVRVVAIDSGVHEIYTGFTNMIGFDKYDSAPLCENERRDLERPKPEDICVVFDFGLTKPSDSALNPPDNVGLSQLVCSRPFLCRTLPEQFESACPDKIGRLLNGHYGAQTEITLDSSDSLYQRLQNCNQYNPGYGPTIAASSCFSITDSKINDPREWDPHGGNGAPLLSEPPP